jgi:hypothetical protein
MRCIQWIIFVAVVFLAGALSADPAAAPAPASAGRVLAVSGKVEVYPVGSDVGKALKLGGPLFAGDRIKTGANGQVKAVLVDGTRLTISYNTDITLRDKNSKGKTSARGIASIKIALGELWAKVTHKDSQLEFETPDAVAAVKGTEPGFVVTGGSNATTCIYLLNGAIKLSNPTGSANMGPLTQVCLSAGTTITQGIIQPWDGHNAPGEGDATNATVELQYKDANNKVQSLQMNYSK